MGSLFNKRIVLGVTGSIAAYKACELVRLLSNAGSEVRVVMTRSAMEFVSPLTFQALSHHTVHRDLLDEQAEDAMGHIELARWADAIIIAPASADFVARLSAGRADDLLSAICLATTAPLSVAPAMNQQMWQDAATQANIQTLRQRNINIFGPGTGEQACGETGPGRLLEPAALCQHLGDMFLTQVLSGRTVLVTAGPTREPIDPVRYISNRSSGRMGYAIAQAVIEAGGKCVLVSGPTALACPEKVERIIVETAQQMLEAVNSRLEEISVLIAAAAVSDYRPAKIAPQKIKKQQDTINLELVRNEDIISSVAKLKPAIFRVGFAAETEQLESNARTKLAEKSLHMIVANDVSRDDSGFDSEDNEVTVFWEGGEMAIDKAPKSRIARQLVEIIAKKLQ